MATTTVTGLRVTHVAPAHSARKAVLKRRNLEGHRHLWQVVLTHVTKLPELAQLHQVKVVTARRLSEITSARNLAHGAGRAVEASNAIHLKQVVEVGLVESASRRSLGVQIQIGNL